MASTQQLHPTPVCRELRDERAPRRLRALRTLCALSVAGWLAFAALVSGTPPEELPTDADPTLALAEIQALQQASMAAALQAPEPAPAAIDRAAPLDTAPLPRSAEPMKVSARLELSH